MLLAIEARWAEFEFQWRWGGRGKWRKAALLHLEKPRARFLVRAGAGGLRAERGFTACAGVRADGVGAYHFGPLVLDAGEHAEVEAEADAAAWPNVLLEPGEFLPVTGVAEIRNVGPSGGVTAGGLARTFKLEECPEACSRRWFAVSGGRVDLNREAS